MGFGKEVEMVRLASKMDLFSIVYVATPDEARHIAEAGADAIIAHVGTTVGGSIGVTEASCSMDEAVERTQAIIDAGKSVNPALFSSPTAAPSTRRTTFASSWSAPPFRVSSAHPHWSAWAWRNR